MCYIDRLILHFKYDEIPDKNKHTILSKYKLINDESIYPIYSPQDLKQHLLVTKFQTRNQKSLTPARKSTRILLYKANLK